MAAAADPASRSVLAAAQAHFEAGRYREAADCCERFLADGDANGEAFLLAGRIAERVGNATAARRLFESAVDTEPATPAYRLALALACANQGALDEAEKHLALILKVAPATYEVHLALGDIDVARYRLAEAEAHYAAAHDLRPHDIDTLIKLSNVANLRDDRATALARIEAVLARDPSHVAANWNRALLLLAAGDLQAGFAAYEWRWSFKNFEFRRPAMPLWDGGDLAGRSILLMAEQGWGDQIQFARYARVLKDRGAGRVVFAAPDRGRALFERLDGADLVVEGRRFPPPCDCYAPLLSVPHRVGTALESIPTRVPYLAADQARVGTWDVRLGHADEVRVGIAWRETPGAVREVGYRDVAAAAFAPLARVAGVRLFALPLDPLPAGLDGAIVPADAERDGDQAFADTAAIVQGLDLVIAPDTVYCHLAGALGRPVWTLLSKAPEWRWMRAGDTTPWYPTMRLFRQTTLGRWDDVIDRVAAELSAFAGTVGRRPALR